MPDFASSRAISAIAGIILALGISACSPPSPAVAQPAAQQRSQSIDDFFRDFTAAWVRSDPDLARATRYFSGEVQDGLERRLTPWTTARSREEIAIARRGLASCAVSTAPR